jgi:hypothetical protein
MSAREKLTWSLIAVVRHIDNGGVLDSTLPGAPTAEAMRLLRNGLSVSSFACFEHFVRERIAELLDAIANSSALPPFKDLPEQLQLAATKGVADAMRFRLDLRNDSLDTATVVSMAATHATAVASVTSTKYRFSPWAFGYASSNVNVGTMNSLLDACGGSHLKKDFATIFKAVDFDYIAAGLGDAQKLKLGNISGWRHEAAHDATLAIDAQLLRTRIFAYIAVACAFDILASLAVVELIDTFATKADPAAKLSNITISLLKPDGDEFRHETPSGHSTVYSVKQLKDTLSEKVLATTGVVVIFDASDQVVDWFFH